MPAPFAHGQPLPMLNLLPNVDTKHVEGTIKILDTCGQLMPNGSIPIMHRTIAFDTSP